MESHYEIAGSFQSVCDNMLTWMKSNLKREKIISLSTHETLIENGDALLIVLYKTAQDSSMSSLDTLKYDLKKNIQDWENHFSDQLKIASGHIEVISYINTPRNIG